MGRHKKPSAPEHAQETPVTVIDETPISPVASASDGIERVEREFAQGTTEEPARRKRRKKADIAAEEQAQYQAAYQADADQFGEASTLLMSIVVERLPNPKPLTDSEMLLCKNAISRLAMKYLPQMEGNGPELMAGIALLAVIVPRLKKQNTEAVEAT